MKKLVLLFLAFLTFACTQKPEKVSDIKSIGKINSLAVFIDDKLWIGEIGDSIRKKFAAPVYGLPQEEPMFTINQYPLRAFEGDFHLIRNAFVIRKEPRNYFYLGTDQFATPQNLIQISGNTNEAILEHIEKNAPTIIGKIQNTEIRESQKIILNSILKEDVLSKRFGVSVQIPKTYKCVLKNDTFVWLKKEIQSGNSSILVYEVPINSIEKDEDIINNIVRMRDSIGEKYIQGTMENSQMITEESYSPYLYSVILDGKTTYETKGTWELRNDFMSGPFINYCVLDKKNNRVLVIEGFCYAPSTPKRDLMHELEAIIRTLKITK